MTTNSADSVSDEEAYAHVDYVLDPRDYPSFHQIEESVVLENWMRIERKSTGKNEIQPVLDRANFFVKHGLTPAYYTDELGMRVFVTSQENADRKLH